MQFEKVWDNVDEPMMVVYDNDRQVITVLNRFDIQQFERANLKVQQSVCKHPQKARTLRVSEGSPCTRTEIDCEACNKILVYHDGSPTDAEKKPFGKAAEGM